MAFILPPIAGYSDVGMRMLCIRYGAELTFTEMVSAKGLVYGNENTRELLITHETEKIKAVQLFGREEGFIARAVQLEPLKKFDIIDITLGCPVHKIVKSGEGSALMKEPEQVYKIIKYAVEAAEGRLVTGKIRAGFQRLPQRSRGRTCHTRGRRGYGNSCTAGRGICFIRALPTPG